MSMRLSFARWWRIVCLLALVLALFPAPAMAQNGLPGVRHRLYESPAFGFTLIWDNTVWKPAESLSEEGWSRLELQSHGSRLWIEAVPAAISVEECANQSYQQMLARPGTHTVIDEPESFWTRGTTTTVDNSGVERTFTWDITCNVEEHQPFLLRFSHYAWTDGYEDLQKAATIVTESVQPPPDDWETRAQSPRTQGVLDVYEAVTLEPQVWTDPREYELRFLTVRLTLDNVDLYDTSFDASLLQIKKDKKGTKVYPIMSVVWLTSGDDPTNPVVTIRAGERMIGQITFLIPSDLEMPQLFYNQQNIAAFGGPVGSASRPRIDPGR